MAQSINKENQGFQLELKNNPLSSKFLVYCIMLNNLTTNIKKKKKKARAVISRKYISNNFRPEQNKEEGKNQNHNSNIEQ